jgi:hypothetical protein
LGIKYSRFITELMKERSTRGVAQSTMGLKIFSADS